MSTLEVALAVSLALVLGAIVGFWLTRRRGGLSVDSRIEQAIASLPTIQQDLGGLKTSVVSLPSEATVRAIESRLAVLEGRVPNSLESNLQRLDTAVTKLETEYSPGNRFDQIHQATSLVSSLLAGGRDRGTAGETLVSEMLRIFPPDMMERDFKVGGKSVEFAVILPNSKRLPLDSKWAAADLVRELEKCSDEVTKDRLIKEIEKEILSRANEVAKYRNLAVTTDIGIAAVPDSAYRVCRKAHFQAYKDWNVLVVPYSMVAPYVLVLYNIHLKYAQNLELGNLQSYLTVIEQQVKQIDDDLENRIKDAAKRSANAYESIKDALAKIREAAGHLRSAPLPSSSSVADEVKDAQAHHV